MPAIFTIVSANYIAFAATLMQSVRQHHPDLPRFIILSDAARSFDGLDLAAEIIACDDLGIKLIGNMKLWYSVIEFNTAIKPFTFQFLFDHRGFGSAIYLDPDIHLYAPLDAVLAGLDSHSLVLTPHMLKPLQDGKHPSDLSIMKSGVYNLGFAALRNDEDGYALLRWWCDRLFTQCRVDVPGNIFTDQRWMDLAPAFVPRTLLLRHPGYNVAYWNLVHRVVDRGPEGAWRADGQALAFFHFSGIDPEDPASFSKHQNRFTVETLGAVAALCDEYRARVLANGWHTYNTVPYAFGAFADGRRILGPMRHWLTEAIDDGRLAQDEPLELEAAFFDQADDRPVAGGGRLTRFAYQAWRDRPDLRAAFNLPHPDDLAEYVAWFCDGAAEHEGLDPAAIAALRVLRDGGPPAGPWRPTPPPWPALATESWAGPARDAAQWLMGDLRFSLNQTDLAIQRQAALLWEKRTDLRQYFPLTSRQGLENYHLWSLTDGMREGSILPGLFTDDYLGWLTAPSGLQQDGDAMPVPNAMALTGRSEHARDGFQVWQDFPRSPIARVEQAFWFAYVAPGFFDWPAALAAPVRAYLDSPSSLAVGSYRLSNGVVALHAMRDDIRSAFTLNDEAGRWRYLCWVLAQGAREYRLAPEELCPGIAAFLATPAPDFTVLSRLAEFAYVQREDLQATFDLRSRVGLAGMYAWTVVELEPWLASIGLSSLLAPPGPATNPEPVQPYRCFVVLSGDWAEPSGIGEDLRTAVAALDACGFTDYLIADLKSARLITSGRAALPAGRPVQADWHVMFHNADTALEDWRMVRKLGIAAGRVAGHWLWELERMPAQWRHAFSFCDEVWASSRFVQGVFEAEARRPVRLLHQAVVVAVPAAEALPWSLGIGPDTTLFLFMFDFASYVARKNPAGVIRAFREAFPGGDEPACLLIKTQNAAIRPDLWDELAALAADPRVILKDAQLSRDELMNLVASADAFVSLHRSEGFGRGPAEAMLLGVPVILTGYSGTADFTDEGCACIVGHELVPVQPGEYPGVEGQSWAEPDVSGAAAHMLWVQRNPAAAKAMGSRGQQRVAEMLAPAKVGADMLALLRNPADLGANPAPG